jgi:hypothetical protein
VRIRPGLPGAQVLDRGVSPSGRVPLRHDGRRSERCAGPQACGCRHRCAGVHRCCSCRGGHCAHERRARRLHRCDQDCARDLRPAQELHQLPHLRHPPASGVLLHRRLCATPARLLRQARNGWPGLHFGRQSLRRRPEHHHHEAAPGVQPPAEELEVSHWVGGPRRPAFQEV